LESSGDSDNAKDVLPLAPKAHEHTLLVQEQPIEDEVQSDAMNNDANLASTFIPIVASTIVTLGGLRSLLGRSSKEAVATTIEVPSRGIDNIPMVVGEEVEGAVSLK